MRALCSFVLVATLGCGGSDFSTGSEPDVATDSSVVDTGVIDTSVSDTGHTDAADAGKTDSAIDSAPVDAGPCRPFWCGCGTCVAADIICTRSEAGCPLGCPIGACPEMDREGLCVSEGDRCVRTGIDAPIACLTTADCPPGQCCSGTFTPPGHGTCGGC
jgi:hypothetical protein